jgi:hypothetical protein
MGFHFQIVHFFHQNANESDFRSSNGEDPSYFSNHRRRWEPSPAGFARKGIYDADGCFEIGATLVGRPREPSALGGDTDPDGLQLMFFQLRAGFGWRDAPLSPLLQLGR